MWLDAGDFLRLGFPNGPSDSNNRLLNYFLENKETLLKEEQLENLEADMKKFGHWDVYNWFESPRIRVSKIEIKGPHQRHLAAAKPSRTLRRRALSKPTGPRRAEAICQPGLAATGHRGRAGARWSNWLRRPKRPASRPRPRSRKD